MSRPLFTLPQLMIAVASVFLSFWLAMTICLHFESPLRWVIFAAIFVARYVAIFFALLILTILFFGWLGERLNRKNKLPTEDKSNSQQ